MRIFRTSVSMLVLAVAATVISARAGAQTCQGLASFADGKWRLGVDYQHSDDLNLYRESAAYGIARSVYAVVNVDESQPTNGSGSLTGYGATIGYQIHLSDTPFQFCPSVFVQSESGSGSTASTTSYGAGGAIGYRVAISDWLELIPAAGIRVMSTSISGAGGSTTGSVVDMALGFVFNRSFTIAPAVHIPSTGAGKDILSLGVLYSWAK